MAPPVIRPGVDPDVIRLWSMPRLDAEAIYRRVFDKDDIVGIRWLGRNDRYFLLSCLLRRPDVRNDWVFDRIREVEADPYDHIDLWAREHMKSSTITFAGSIQEILNDPEITIGIFSYDRPAATVFLNQIKVEFEENDLLKKVYDDILWADPIKQARRWGEQSGLVVKRKGNPKEATIEAWGVVDGQPTGRHFRLRVYDDLVTQKNVTTPEQVRKTTESFDLSENLGVRGGHQVMCGTRYHYADTYAALIARGLLKERRYPATNDGTFDGTPVFFTQEEWNRRKQGSRAVVAAQHLLNPLAGTETAFDPRMLKFWRVRPRRCTCYIIADPSKGKNASSDFTAIVVILIDAAGNKYLVDGWRQRMTLSQRWTTLRDAYRRYRAMPGILDVRVGYEQFGMQTDNEYFEERMLTERMSFPIEELNWPRTGPKSKQQRIERLEPQFRLGRLLLPEVIQINDEGIITVYDVLKTKEAQEAIAANEKWRVAQPIHKKDNDRHVYDFMAALMEEFMFFPFAGYDDILDAMSRIVDMDPQPPAADYSETGGSVDAATMPEVFVDGI